MVGADLLVLLSDVDGLYSADPRRDKGATHIARVAELSPEIDAMAGGVNTEAGVGSGGMATKLAAARIAASAGCATLIAPGPRRAPLSAVEAGARATLIEPATTPAAAYKAWIAGSLAPQGFVTVDAGAASALRAGKSLLPAGSRRSMAASRRATPSWSRAEDGREIARGLSRYDAAEAARIMGCLGRDRGPARLHRRRLADPRRRPGAQRRARA